MVVGRLVTHLAHNRGAFHVKSQDVASGVMNGSIQGLATRAAAARRLLLAVDYDGTLAHMVEDPRRAAPDQRALNALMQLAGLRNTTVAVVTGRDRQDLLAVAPSLSSPMVRVIASHGAESGPRSRSEKRNSRNLARVLRRVASQYPGARVEVKAHGAALHTRGLPAYVGESALASAAKAGHFSTAKRVIRGNQVVEITAAGETKGDAVLSLLSELHPQVTIYVGDDTTDEDAFAALQSEPAGETVKVGDGPTHAKFRLRDVDDVRDFLELLAALRKVELQDHRQR